MRISVKKSNGVTSYKLTSDLDYIAALGQVFLFVIFIYTSLASPLWYLTLVPLLCIPVIRLHTTESVLVVTGLGVQLEERGRLRYWSDCDKFIAVDDIRAVFINEIFEGCQVNYVLQIIMKKSNEVCLAFRYLRPGAHTLRQVWKCIERA